MVLGVISTSEVETTVYTSVGRITSREARKMAKEIEQQQWQTTTNRFVAFFDILGFKELVLKSSHSDTLTKLTKLRERVINFSNLADSDFLKKFGVSKDQTQSVTFSDSFIFFQREVSLRML